MLLSEKLLQYVWLHRVFNTHDLQTTKGEPLRILSPGTWNNNAGPDFLDARIQVGNTLLAGNVELHLKASDWIKHRHDTNMHYKNLILHVVHESDLGEDDLLPPYVPAVELQGRIPRLLLERYANLMQHDGNILCAGQLNPVDDLTWLSWKDRLLVERWQQKTALFAQWMDGNQNNWDETFYKALARNFGVPVNGDAFEALAASLPLKVVMLHKHNLLQTEALLFGQAGMLNERFGDKYPQKLQQEYQFLQKKYQLTPVKPHLWKWMRMRPSAFPTIRIAQFAALIHQSLHLFSKILGTAEVKSIYQMFDVSASPSWDHHYRFIKRNEISKDDKTTPGKGKNLGKNMIENILINTICPMLAMYDRFQLHGNYLDRAFQWMRTLPAENNRYTREWEEINIPNTSAWDSQALLHLTKNYCMEKRCLSCSVGNKILRDKKE
jgi:hypothetical protein